MNEEPSKVSGFLKKLGVTPQALVQNRVMEFLVERYVNWTTEAQRRFRKVMGAFLLCVGVAIVVLVYLTTIEKHKIVESHHLVYQMLKKYVIKKNLYEKRLSSLQSGGSGMARNVTDARLSQILGANEVFKEMFRVQKGETEEAPLFLRKAFLVTADKLTYPQIVKVLFDIESLGKNVHVTDMEVSTDPSEKGFYAMKLDVSVVEPKGETEGN